MVAKSIRDLRQEVDEAGECMEREMKLARVRAESVEARRGRLVSERMEKSVDLGHIKNLSVFLDASGERGDDGNESVPGEEDDDDELW